VNGSSQINTKMMQVNGFNLGSSWTMGEKEYDWRRCEYPVLKGLN
jgi:hypothetical protein